MDLKQQTNDSRVNIKPLKRNSMIIATSVSGVLALAGSLVPAAALLLFMLSAGFMAAAVCINKNIFPVVSVLPAVGVAALAYRDITSVLLLLMIPVCALAMSACVIKGAKKAVTVIVCSVALGMIMAIVFVTAVASLYGTFSFDVLKQLEDDFHVYWEETVEDILTNTKKQQLATLEQYEKMNIAIDREEFMEDFEKTLEQYRVLLLDDMPVMLKMLTPAIVVIFLNILSYFAVAVLFRFVCEKRYYAAFVKKEDKRLELAVPGMIIYGIAYILSLITGGYETVAGAVFTNVFLIYMPALALIGLRILLFEGGIRKNLFYFVMICIVGFLNPVFVLPLLGFFAAGNRLNGVLVKYLQAKSQNGRH